MPKLKAEKHLIYFYPVVSKAKSRDICTAFAAGCGGRVVHDNKLRDCDAGFYGVDSSNMHIWRAVLADHSRSFWYLDNAYFDGTRQKYFRVTKNLLQHNGVGESDCTRFNALGLPVAPWRKQGRQIVVIEQSSSFMSMPGGYEGNWLDNLLPKLEKLTKRELVVRRWGRDKAKAANTLAQDLIDAHALITWSSAAAVTSIMTGVPVVALGQSCAEPLSGSLLDLEQLPMPPRYTWLGLLADNQFTLEEMRSGQAWEFLNGKHALV